MIKLLVLDIDGTIAGKSNDVSDVVKSVIQAVQAQGIQVAIATGRMYRSALRFHQAIGSQLPMIVYNGAWIQDPATSEIHRHLPLCPQAALELLNYFEQPEFLAQVGVHFYVGDRLYVREINPETKRYAQRSGIKPIAVGDLRGILDAHPTKVLALSQQREVMAKLRQELAENLQVDGIHLTQSTETFLEATHPQANKGEATRYLAEQILGLTAEEVMAIGDNFNDKEMLDYVGVSVAMGDAPTAIQSLADWVAPTVEEDGAAIAIKKFLF